MTLELKLRKLAEHAIENAEIKKSGTNAGPLFRPIADLIMNECVLIAETGEFRIAEIEFYLATVRHDDETTHTSARQQQFGSWSTGSKIRTSSPHTRTAWVST